jgi:outer membrane protein assembly factor BamB
VTYPPIHVRAAFRFVTVLLSALALGAPLRAQIVSVLDFNLSAGHSYVLGLERRGGTSILFSTTAEVYEAQVYSGSPMILTKLLVASDFMEGIEANSSVASNPLDNNRLFYTNISAFTPAVTGILIAPPNTITVTPLPTSTGPGTITFDSAGALYYFQGNQGVQKMAAGNYGTSVLSFGNSGPGALASQSYGLAVANNVVYALDLPNHRIARFDAGTGGYLGAFAVTGDHADSVITVSSNGRLYLSTGNGGGNIYNATTGATLDTFQATSSTFNGNGRDALLLDDASGYLYTFDAATGAHVFHDAALTAIPEPATYAVIVGACTLGVAGWRSRKKRLAGFVPEAK